ncbi:hypothetical protein DICTH_1826 [Dictyoglomus thermophilum H-6-12]|uniref:Uncharacterized protein n=1 Tax=Dictyoglomus thermophilum (strain ATCC 35947 / DSM 3960 / H-6-12) TaxID=309799 RepID=B5YBA9_DICT6|nr:hypothetical protein DICTH_1826 [Dictyoglomus thermophilum H-6-12]
MVDILGVLLFLILTKFYNQKISYEFFGIYTILQISMYSLSLNSNVTFNKELGIYENLLGTPMDIKGIIKRETIFYFRKLFPSLFKYQLILSTFLILFGHLEFSFLLLFWLIVAVPFLFILFEIFTIIYSLKNSYAKGIIFMVSIFMFFIFIFFKFSIFSILGIILFLSLCILSSYFKLKNDDIIFL